MKKEKTDQRKPESRLFQVKPVRLLALEKQLRKVANYISNLGEIILDNNDPTTINAYQNALLEYSELLKPWSKTLANEMVDTLNADNIRDWKQFSREYSQEIGSGLRDVINQKPINQQLGLLKQHASQVIASMPDDFSQRIDEMVKQSLIRGDRGKEIWEKLKNVKGYSNSQATRIARTLIAQSSNNLVIARATAVGCNYYVWHCQHDARTRPSHKAMDGKICSMHTPPVVDKGEPGYHPGWTWNCRCWMEPKFDQLSPSAPS